MRFHLQEDWLMVTPEPETGQAAQQLMVSQLDVVGGAQATQSFEILSS
jgi:hypothetical protein